ncbi:uncharacterized protein LOC143223805 [Tachypleus tridentatus]|uniref:uncharacterized protein LOC143223805 n=1 Tax=Tachypleus tridentatus TaxID=6853 RepID=UPI003FD48504
MCSIDVVEVKDGIESIWHAFQWAVSAVGLYVTQGDIIWEVYREFDDTFLGTLQNLFGIRNLTAPSNWLNIIHRISIYLHLLPDLMKIFSLLNTVFVSLYV